QVSGIAPGSTDATNPITETFLFGLNIPWSLAGSRIVSTVIVCGLVTAVPRFFWTLRVRCFASFAVPQAGQPRYAVPCEHLAGLAVRLVFAAAADPREIAIITKPVKRTSMLIL